jgi:TrmH family RNA methyltransferase
LGIRPLKPTIITSRDNSLLRRARAVRDGQITELIFVEGLRLCEELLASGLNIEAVIYSEEIAQKERAANLVGELSRICDRLASVSEKLLATISYTRTPQGIIALAARPVSGPAKLQISEDVPPLLAVMHGINNPVNVGAIVRSAEAAGVTGVITTEHTTDPFSPKALRGAMGSAFRLPFWMGASYLDILAWCSGRGIETVCADLEAATLYTDVDWRRSRALIVGPEATGLTQHDVAAARQSVRIPMQGNVESLNVAVAAAIVLYEAARQRKQRT